jgi:hypothetical protein
MNRTATMMPTGWGKPLTLQILTVLPGNADSAKRTGWSDRDGGGTVCLDIKAVLAYKDRGVALQFLTANPDDPWHDGPFSGRGGRKILPISDEGAGKKFLRERSHDAIDGTDTRDR